MTSQEFVHLHVHTNYSLLNSQIQIPALAKKLNDFQMKACAITDQGNLYGALSFYYTMKKHGVHPIIGYEAYLTTNDRRDRKAALNSGERPYYSLILLAENLEGYYNLVKLSSKAFTEGLHHKPRIDFELLSAHNRGLIAISPQINGLIGHCLLQNKFDKAQESASQLKDIFGNRNFFLSIQNHELETEKQTIKSVVELSKKLDLNLMATADAYYVNPEDAKAHEVMLCIGSGKTVNDETHPRLGSDKFYLRNATEMWQLFGSDFPEALQRTIEISERCQVTLPHADDALNLPIYPIPPKSGCTTIDDYFEQTVQAGFENRRRTVWEKSKEKGALHHELEIYEERIKKETDIIRRMGYSGYFLIVWDFVQYAKENGIPVGPGRGSAAGSLVAYCLEITDVDPIQYDLLFERFLNPERVTMPDIDIDFCIRGRDPVIKHVVNQYGRDSVCQIITFGTMASKAVVKDVGRALNMPYSEVEKIAKLIPPPVRGRNVSISQALEQVEDLKTAVDGNSQIKELIDLAQRLEGCVRHTSVHAAGVVISPQPLEELVPIAVSVKDELTTQFAMSDLEKTGMLKMDFLALTTLTVINDCLNSIKQTIGEQVDWTRIDLNDPQTMKIFGDGHTEAIFQFESPGMQEICRRLKPKDIEDLAALNALYRPGPLDGGMVDDFINRHKGRKQVRYLVPQMKDILNNTYGIIVYQEQIMQLAQKLAGYTLGEADMMRRAMGKKKREEMARHQEKFVAGAVERNIKKEKAEQIFSLMAQFADYGFNRSHSVAYAFLAFQTAYLKAHFPAHFYAAVLSHEAQDAAKVQKYIAELKSAGIELLPPDINESRAGFTPLQNSIRFGLSAIKGIGETAVDEIIKERAASPYFSFKNFVTRTSGSVNKRGLQNLICGGAFDSLKSDDCTIREWRSKLLADIEQVVNQSQKERIFLSHGQNGLFAPEQSIDLHASQEPYKIMTEKEFWAAEKETLGIHLSAHPLSNHEQTLKELKAHNISCLNKESVSDAEAKIWIAGIISDYQTKTSKKGNQFAIFKLEDCTASIKCIAWSETFNKYSSLFGNDEVIVAAGRVEIGEESSNTFIVDEICRFENAIPSRAESILISLPSPEIKIFEDLLHLLNNHRGPCEVLFDLPILRAPSFRAKLCVHGSLRIRGSIEVAKELENFGCRIEWKIRQS